MAEKKEATKAWDETRENVGEKEERILIQNSFRQNYPETQSTRWRHIQTVRVGTQL